MTVSIKLRYNHKGRINFIVDDVIIHDNDTHEITKGVKIACESALYYKYYLYNKTGHL
jgi:hypothetical protein